RDTSTTAIYTLSLHDALPILTNTAPVSWESIIGNLKKWKEGEVLEGKILIEQQEIVLRAVLLNREQRIVEFQWDGGIPFVALVEDRKSTRLNSSHVKSSYAVF